MLTPDFILDRNPHSPGFMVHCIDALLDYAKTVVIGNTDPDFRSVNKRLRDDWVLVDFVRMTNDGRKNGNYDGICW